MDISKLIKLEWHKWKANTTIMTLSILYMVLLPVSVISFREIVDSMDTGDGPSFIPKAEQLFSFPQIWDYAAYTGSWLIFLFLGFVGIFIWTSEITNKTMRQNIITGISRNHWFISKILVLVIVSLAATLYFTISTAIIGYLLDASATPISRDWWIIGRYFLMCLANLSFGLLFAVLLKRSGLAIFLFTAYQLFLELFIRYGILAKAKEASFTLYFPQNVIEDLMPLPFFKLAAFISGDSDFLRLLSDTEAVVGTSLYITLFLGLSFWLFKKADI